MKLRAILAFLLALVLQACAAAEPDEGRTTALPSPTAAASVSWPRDKLTLGDDGVPMLSVYIKEDEAIRDVDLESYLQGVLAGEMKTDWPLEALKAQAILARTFVLKFIAEKESRYEGADISTDVEEAQAYNASAINENVKRAVRETRGLVLSSDGELPYAWFHAHSGGTTALAKEGLGWEKAEPGYTAVVKGNEPEADGDQALEDAASWTARFSFEELASACKTLGKSVSPDADSKLEVASRGESGRVTALRLDGVELTTSSLRIALGSTKMRSTLLTEAKLDKDGLVFSGKGYGHGVGMSQWGAYGMAKAGETAEAIVAHYFQNVNVERLW